MSVFRWRINCCAIFLIVFVLAGCSPRDDTVQTISPQCISAQSVCDINVAVGKFEIGFNQSQPKAETPFEIHVNYLGHNQLTKLTGHIEGVDMFMGKIPLFFQIQSDSNNEQQHYATEAMFGSCSLVEMKWRVFFNAELIVNNETQKQQFFIEFTSFRP